MKRVEAAKMIKTVASRLVRLLLFCLAFSTLNTLPSALSAAVPFKLNYHGNLRQSGFLANGNHKMVFRLYDSASAVTPLWTSPNFNVELSTGVFRVTLAPAITDWESGSLWLELEVEGNRLSPREELTSSFYAINSELQSGKKYTSGDTEPLSPNKGDLWMNTAGNMLYFQTGSGWSTAAGSGAAHAATHAGGGIDAITSLGAHSITGNVTLGYGVSLRSAGQGVPVSTNLIADGILNPFSNLNAGGAGYSVSFASSVWAGMYNGSSLYLSGASGYSGNMAVIFSEEDVPAVIRMTGRGGIYASKYYGDGSALTGITGSGGGAADNLGNHTATTNLIMGPYQITGTGAVTMSSFTATGIGLKAAQLLLADNVVVSPESGAAQGGGVRVSSNVYIVGFASATKYYGDGSGLTGITGSGGGFADNLGNHTATTNLIMGANQITGTGSVTMSSFTATGIGVRAAQLLFAENIAFSPESGAAQGGGVRVSSNVYIVGFASATKYFGDGSSLTCITGGGGAADNLGNHTATTNLIMGANQITGSGAVTMSSFTATGIGVKAAQLLLA
ncbi:MAG: hypothetical protein NTX59_04530, partial [Elusimicrobia bacterium]|nr:hypothetical protein [Elusimicrobiota bacterium]